MMRTCSFAATAALAIVLLSWTVPLITAFQPLEPRSLRTSGTYYSHAKIRLHQAHQLPRCGSSALHAIVSKQDTVDTLNKVTSVASATMITYYLHNRYRIMSPVLASGLVSLLSSILLPEKLALAALCGSFAGMAKMAVIPTLFSITLLDSAFLLGIVCGVMLGLFDKNGWLVGKGGRLGTIAQCACTLQFIVLEFATNHLNWNAVKRPATTAALVNVSVYKSMLSITRGGMEQQQQLALLVTLMLFTMGGALFMRTFKYLTSKLFSSHWRLSNSVVAAVGVTGVVGGCVFSPVHAGAAFCGSFVAMSNSNTLSGVTSLLVASALAGASQFGLAGVLLGGWGGKLGTAALLGVLWFQLSRFALSRFFSLKKRKGGQQET